MEWKNSKATYAKTYMMHSLSMTNCSNEIEHGMGNIFGRIGIQQMEVETNNSMTGQRKHLVVLRRIVDQGIFLSQLAITISRIKFLIIEMFRILCEGGGWRFCTRPCRRR